MGGTWIHRLTNIDETTRTADCFKCGKTSIIKRHSINKPSGWRCKTSKLEIDSRGGWDIIAKKSAHREFLKDNCNLCGFIAKDKCQLDIDHIDGNKHNTDKSNLQTLCANCHRLKTKNNQDYRSYKSKLNLD